MSPEYLHIRWSMPGRLQNTEPSKPTVACAGSSAFVMPSSALYGWMSGSQISESSGVEKAPPRYAVVVMLP